MSLALLVQPSTSMYLPNPRQVLTTSHVVDAISQVSNSVSPHRLRPLQPSATRFKCSSSALDLGHCSLLYVQYGFDVEIDVDPAEDFYFVKSTIAGTGRLRCGDESAITSCRSIFITRPTERSRILMTPQCRHLTARIARAPLEARLAQRLDRRLTTPLRFEFQVPSDSEFGKGWRHLLSHICQLSSDTPSILAPTAVRKGYAQTMMDMLIYCAPHNYSSSISTDRSRPIPWYVGRAREYVHRRMTEVLTVAELAASVGTTVRTLQNGFRLAFDITPAEYIRRERIKALHQALLAADPTQSVTSMMQGLGIASFGRYAQYYRQQIGETPSQTLHRPC
jgi:AraC-like DNA-binding protein